MSEGKRANVMEMPSTLETNPDASNEQPNSSDENSIGSRNPLESQTATPDQVLGDKNMNYWDRLPLEMSKKILRISIQSSRNPCETYQSLYKTCQSFRDTVDMISSNILPRLYINNLDKVTTSMHNGKMKVSVRELTKQFGVSSGISLSISDHVGKNWKSAWLVLVSEDHCWFSIRKVFWKQLKHGINVVQQENSKTWSMNAYYHLKKRVFYSSTIRGSLIISSMRHRN